MFYDAEACLAFLTEKERLWKLKSELAREVNFPIVSCGLNISNTLKCEERFLDLCKRMTSDLLVLLSLKGFPASVVFEETGILGYITLIIVNEESQSVKKACVEFEESRPALRLFDADVMDAKGHQISRDELGLASRRCYLCSKPAKYCSAVGTHSPKDVLGAIERLLSEYAPI
jgi:holo-ACP synthase CitX